MLGYMEELLALTLTSKTDMRILKNTCAGIKSLITMGLIAQIRKIKSVTHLADRAKSDN